MFLTGNSRLPVSILDGISAVTRLFGMMSTRGYWDEINSTSRAVQLFPFNLDSYLAGGNCEKTARFCYAANFRARAGAQSFINYHPPEISPGEVISKRGSQNVTSTRVVPQKALWPDSALPGRDDADSDIAHNFPFALPNSPIYTRICKHLLRKLGTAPSELGRLNCSASRTTR